MVLGRTVSELETELSEAEFIEWMAYDSIMPIGDKGAYWRTGMIASTLTNINRDPKKSKAFTPEDFMPAVRKPVPDGLNPKLVKAKMFAVFGDRIKRKTDGPD